MAPAGYEFTPRGSLLPPPTALALPEAWLLPHMFFTLAYLTFSCSFSVSPVPGFYGGGDSTEHHRNADRLLRF